MIQTEWTLREEAIYLSQRWYLLVLAFLVGALLGWGIAYLLPSSSEAKTELYVAFNADIYPRNPDDYKNWQLQELDAFILSDPVISETAAQLNLSYPKWADFTAQTLASQLDTRWRNAGFWTLVASAQTPAEAQAIAATWQNITLQQLTEAATHSQNMLELERQIRQIINERYLLESRLQSIVSSQNSLSEFSNSLLQVKGSQPLTELERWNLQLLVGQAVGTNPVSSELLDQILAEDAPAADYIPFIESVTTAADVQISELDSQIAALNEQFENDNRDWQQESEAARGITAYLTVEPVHEGDVTVEATNTSATVALIGGIVGLLAFFFYRLVLRSRQP